MVNELTAVVAELGGAAVLGRPLTTDDELRTAIREGFPARVVQQLMRASGLTLKDLSASLSLSARSLQRRGQQGRLAGYESDRLYRLARILALARDAVGAPEAAAQWLKAPNRALGGATPLQLLDTEPGARLVENVLGRIAYGGIS